MSIKASIKKYKVCAYIQYTKWSSNTWHTYYLQKSISIHICIYIYLYIHISRHITLYICTRMPITCLVEINIDVHTCIFVYAYVYIYAYSYQNYIATSTLIYTIFIGATSEDIRAHNDNCAISREPMDITVYMHMNMHVYICV